MVVGSGENFGDRCSQFYRRPVSRKEPQALSQAAASEPRRKREPCPLRFERPGPGFLSSPCGVGGNPVAGLLGPQFALLVFALCFFVHC